MEYIEIPDEQKLKAVSYIEGQVGVFGPGYKNDKLEMSGTNIEIFSGIRQGGLKPSEIVTAGDKIKLTYKAISGKGEVVEFFIDKDVLD